MKRLAAFAVVISAGLAACQSSEDRARKADDAKREADQKASEISHDTDQKLSESKQKAAEDQDRIAREGQKKTDEVRQASEKTTRDNAGATVRARADLRDAAQKKLDGLDKDVADLDKKLNAKLSREEYDRVMRDLREKGDAARQSITGLDQTTDFDAAKDTIDGRLDAYESAVGDAKKKL